MYMCVLYVYDITGIVSVLCVLCVLYVLCVLCVLCVLYVLYVLYVPCVLYVLCVLCVLYCFSIKVIVPFFLYQMSYMTKLYHWIYAEPAKNRPKPLLAGGPKSYFDGNQ